MPSYDFYHYRKLLFFDGLLPPYVTCVSSQDRILLFRQWFWVFWQRNTISYRRSTGMSLANTIFRKQKIQKNHKKKTSVEVRYAPLTKAQKALREIIIMMRKFFFKTEYNLGNIINVMMNLVTEQEAVLISRFVRSVTKKSVIQLSTYLSPQVDTPIHH